ncbi:glycosyl hydrolase family 28 protein [Nostoc sp. NMS8]|uniref:glycosyl hydrolase family 28 protein n=1 Tax=Nostoc sp. NMS8 TaxID=2815392 RepID=UPI0025E2561B|nr:glycosyl hydrolase family 28 protein [Nostoc sp. NMS8]MBN3960628.1 hypothetical protein [Nostoc sp. NMS8]
MIKEIAFSLYTLQKKVILIFLVIICSFIAPIIAGFNSSLSSNESMIITYPYSASAHASDTYLVTVNGNPLFVEKYNSLSYVHFSFVGQAYIEIIAKENINNYTLSPKSYNIKSKKNRNSISFLLTTPRKLILHKVNLLNEKLFILADSIEEHPPQLGDANVRNIMQYSVDNTGREDNTLKIQRAINDVAITSGVLYFPPGVYKTKQINLRSNITLYLAGGSVIEATKDINPSYGRGLIVMNNVRNVKLTGRGTINGNGSHWRPKRGWYSLIEAVNTSNILIEGIILRDPAVANIWMKYSEGLKIYNVKILADSNFLNTDGFDCWSSRNIVIDNVLYKGTDDATALKGDKNGWIENTEYINIKNSVFYGGNGFKIGTEVKQNFIRHITYENIDIVLANEMSGFWPITGANFEDIYFKNIRVEQILSVAETDKSASLFQWRIMVGKWEPDSSTIKLGYIRDVHIYNMMIDQPGGEFSVFEGYDKQRNIDGIVFENLYIRGNLVTKLEEAFFKFFPSKKDGSYHIKLKFAYSNPSIVNIIVKKLYATGASAIGEFLITRTGDVSKALTLKYVFGGTAENGKDYEAISNSITIPVGASSKSIIIKPKNNDKHKSLKTVILHLDNLPNSNKYMLGPNVDGVVNISNL